MVLFNRRKFFKWMSSTLAGLTLYGWRYLAGTAERRVFSVGEQDSAQEKYASIDNRIREKNNLSDKLVPVSQRKLGKTGIFVSLLGLGGGGLIARENETNNVRQIIDYALDHGVNYIDTAPTYGASERNIGEAIKDRREEIFLATKTLDRGYDETMRLFQQSLQRLQTNYIDLYQIHGISDERDLAVIEEKRGAARALLELKEEGMVRFIGVTGHNHPDLLYRAIEALDFDCLMIPLNAGDIHDRPFQNALLTRAREKDMGIIAMKVMAYGNIFRDDGITSGEQALHYTCSLPCSTAVVGVSSLDEMKENIASMQSFELKSPGELEQMEALTAHYAADVNFFKHQW